MAAIDDEFTEMLEDIHDIFAQSSITITQKTAGDFNAVTQTRAETTSTATVTADRSARRSSSGAMGTKETVYRVRATQFAAATPAFVPAEGDTVTDGSEVLRITRVENEVNDLSYTLICQKKSTPTAG